MAPKLIVGNNALPAQNLGELIGWLRSNPEKATAGTIGAGSPGHVGGIYFQKETGTRFRFVTYRGRAPANQDLVAGHVALRIAAEASQMLPHIRSGKLKAFAVLANTRWFAAPDIPTIEEGGVPGLHISVWTGLWAPNGTSELVIRNPKIVSAMANSILRQRASEIGFEIPPGQRLTPTALAAYHRAGIESGGRSSKPKISKLNKPRDPSSNVSDRGRLWALSDVS